MLKKKLNFKSYMKIATNSMARRFFLFIFTTLLFILTLKNSKNSWKSVKKKKN